MVKLVGMPFVFWIGSVWAGAWTALLIVVLLSALFIGMAIDAARDERRKGRADRSRSTTGVTETMARTA